MLFVFLLFWIVLNGKVTGEILVTGVVISSLVFLFAGKYLNYSVKKDLIMLQKIPYIGLYIGNLILEVIKSTWSVLGFVFSVKYEVEPVLIHVTMTFRTRAARVLMANYITLTPGTITVDVEGDDYTIHCLDSSFAEGIQDGRMVKIIRKMEG